VAWLLREGEVLAAIDVATSRSARRRGLLGRDGIDGALLLRPAHSVHTLAMRFPIDVAYCAPHQPRPDAVAVADLVASLTVLETVCMGRFRVGRPRLRASCVIEAEAGAFDRWGLRSGDLLEVR
jgi:hypothetical protein